MTLPDAHPAADVATALRELDDTELREAVYSFSRFAQSLADDGKPRLTDLFHAVSVAAAEEQDRRAAVIEDLRVEFDDGIGAGALLSEVDDPSQLWDGRE